MTTKRERGRDPEQHVTHAGISAADNFTGMHGELTMVAEAGSAHAQVIQLRAHNGIDIGGYVVPVIPADEPRAPLPLASVPPKFPATGETTLITHELGYTPLVQVIDANGRVVPQTTLQVDGMVVTVAGPASNNTNDHTHAGPSYEVWIPVPSEVVNWAIEHHDAENFTFTKYTGAPLALLLR